MAQRRIPNKNKSTLNMTSEGAWWWAGISLFDSDCPHDRTKARRQSCQRFHPEALSRSESWQREGHLLPLHMCYRHREYPLCVCCCERHNPTTEPEGIQPGLKSCCAPLTRARKPDLFYLQVLWHHPAQPTWWRQVHHAAMGTRMGDGACKMFEFSKTFSKSCFYISFLNFKL